MGHRTKKVLEFTFVELVGRKTNKWIVSNSLNDEPLGDIRWFGRWRQYAFFPLDNLVFEKTCLRSIADFCEFESGAHRRRQAK